MAANVDPIFQAQPKTTTLELDNADGTTAAVLYTAGVNGAIIDSIAVTTDDTSDVTLVLKINDGSNDFTIGEVVILDGAGTNGTDPAQNLLSSTALPFLQSGGGLALGPNFVLKIGAKTAITAAKVVHLVALGGDY